MTRWRKTRSLFLHIGEVRADLYNHAGKHVAQVIKAHGQRVPWEATIIVGIKMKRKFINLEVAQCWCESIASSFLKPPH